MVWLLEGPEPMRYNSLIDFIENLSSRPVKTAKEEM
jgi:hypothetical protein